MAEITGCRVIGRQSLAEISLTPRTLLDELHGLFSCAEGLFNTARHRRTYGVAGETFVAYSDLEGYLNAVDMAVASHGAGTARNARIFIGVAGENGCPSITWRASHFEERRVETFLAPTRYRMYHYQPLSYWQIYDRQTATGLQILGGADQYPAWDLGSPLRNFLQWHLASRDGALIHAGTLGVKDKGVLLAGVGGSGKSGTVLSGILSGLTTVGDDYVFVTPSSLRAYPLFETLKQDAAGLKRLGLTDHPSMPAKTNWQGKYQFYMRDLGLHDLPVSLSLNALLLPRISGQEQTTLTPVSAKEAFLALAPSGVTQIPGDRPLLYATAGEISRQLPCFRLDLGSDPDEVYTTIRQFIEEM
jgi:hypothetical protein